MQVTRSGGGSDKLKSLLAQIDRKQVSVGFFDTSKYPDGTPIAYVAAIQEFGYPGGNIPARPFMRPTMEEQRSAWANTLRRGYKAVINEQISLVSMLEQFGALAAGQVKVTITKVTAPVLADATIAARQSRKKTKGVSTKPLVDTGFMLSQVNHAVEDK